MGYDSSGLTEIKKSGKWYSPSDKIAYPWGWGYYLSPDDARMLGCIESDLPQNLKLKSFKGLPNDHSLTITKDEDGCICYNDRYLGETDGIAYTTHMDVLEYNSKLSLNHSYKIAHAMVPGKNILSREFEIEIVSIFSQLVELMKDFENIAKEIRSLPGNKNLKSDEIRFIYGGSF